MGIDPHNDSLDLSTLDRGDDAGGVDADVPPADTPPADPPPADNPPADPPADPPPADNPPADPPPADNPPADPPAPAGKKDHMIPKARLDEEIRKRREMEARLKALEEKLAKPADEPAPPDPATVKGTDEWFDTQEAAYMDAVLDGRPDDAKRIRKEIRSVELSKAEELAAGKATKAAREVEIVDEYNAAAEELETAFPVFNVDSDEYDDGMTKAVLAMQDAILRKDPTVRPAVALKDAAARLGYKLAAAPATDDAPPAKPDPAPAAQPTRLAPKPPAQPPRGGGGESRAAPATPSRITEAAVARMSAEELARARGDIL